MLQTWEYTLQMVLVQCLHTHVLFLNRTFYTSCSESSQWFNWYKIIMIVQRVQCYRDHISKIVRKRLFNGSILAVNMLYKQNGM